MDVLKEEQELLRMTRQVLGLGEREMLTMTPILKGGSDRRFYRVKNDVNISWIVMRYGLEKRENSLFADIGDFLHRLGLAVPKIIKHDATSRTLWMEDLGAVDLYSASVNGRKPDLDLYEEVIRSVALLHHKAWGQARQEGLQLMPGFDEALYAWERNYFYEEFLGTFCQCPLTEEEKEKVEAVLSPLAVDLARKAGDLVHRDFQSQNIIIHAGKPYFIDFQGMRLGVRHYDLASLIFDPYMDIDAQNRERLLTFAFAQDAKRQDEVEFRHDLQLAGVQRLMQALGAYGMLGIKKGKREFLQYIPKALESLKILLGQNQATKGIGEIILDGRCEDLN